MFHLHGCCGSADIESINYLVVNRPQLLQRPKNHHQLFSGNFSYVSSAPLKVHQILTLQEPCHVRFLYFLQTNVSILQRAEFFKGLLDEVGGAMPGRQLLWCLHSFSCFHITGHRVQKGGKKFYAINKSHRRTFFVIAWNSLYHLGFPSFLIAMSESQYLVCGTIFQFCKTSPAIYISHSTYM